MPGADTLSRQAQQGLGFKFGGMASRALILREGGGGGGGGWVQGLGSRLFFSVGFASGVGGWDSVRALALWLDAQCPFLCHCSPP